MEICPCCSVRQTNIFLTYISEESVSHRSLCAPCAEIEAQNDPILRRILADAPHDEPIKVVIDSRELQGHLSVLDDETLDAQAFEMEDGAIEMWEIGADDDEDPFADDGDDADFSDDAFSEAEDDFETEAFGVDPFENGAFEDDFDAKSAVFGVGSRHLRCESCATTWEKIKSDGRCGCSQCYETFGAQLLGVVTRCQRAATHVGKSPTWENKRRLRAQSEAKRHANRLALLQKRLDEAVAAEKYEDAAQLRDKLKSLENE